MGALQLRPVRPLHRGSPRRPLRLQVPPFYPLSSSALPAAAARAPPAILASLLSEVWLCRLPSYGTFPRLVPLGPGDLPPLPLTSKLTAQSPPQGRLP